MDLRGWLTFTDRRDRDAFPIYDAAGLEVARIKTSRAPTRFTATDRHGAFPCQGAATWLGLSGVWRAPAPSRQPLLTVRRSPVRARAVVSLHRGGDVAVSG
jgi:hypothetical protein